MRTIWYKRSGQQTTRKAVQAAKDAYAAAKRTGDMGLLKCSIQPEIADAINRMSLEQFVNWGGQFTYKRVER